MDATVTLTGVRATATAGPLMQTYTLPVVAAGSVKPYSSGTGAVR